MNQLQEESLSREAALEKRIPSQAQHANKNLAQINLDHPSSASTNRTRTNMIEKSTYTVKIARTQEEVQKIRDIWESMQYHPNADIDFYLTIVNSKTDIVRPYVMVLYANGDPKAMVIGRINEKIFALKIGYKTLWKPKVRALSIIYGGILGETSNSIADVIMHELMRFLDQGETDVIFFSNIQVGSTLYTLAKKKPMLLCRELITVPSLHRKMSLPDTIDEFYQKMNSKHRYWIRRVKRQLEEAYPGKVVIKAFRQIDQIDQFCRDAEKIAEKTYQRGLGAGFIDNDENRRRLDLSAHRGWLRAYILYVEEKPCAFWIGTLYKETLHLNCTGYDQNFRKHEPGMIVFMEMIRELCREGVSEIDFGFGDAFYKERFGNDKWEEANVYIYPRTIKGIALNSAKTSTTLISLLADKIINNLNLRNRLKKMWRNTFIPKGKT
jgi:hypothetical protein